MRINIFLTLLMIPFLLASCTKDDTDISVPAQWEQLASFKGTPRASACGFACDGKIFVGLGRYGARSGYLKDFWCFNLADSTWKRVADFPGKARVKAVAQVIGHKAYVGMGASGVYNTYSDFWCYDIDNDKWTEVASFPGSGSNELMSAVADSCIYTCWGFDGKKSLPETWQYNPRTDKWTRMHDGPIRRLSAVGFAIGQYFYVGSGYQNHNYKDLYRYDTRNDSWSQMKDMPEYRMLSNALSVGGKGYVLLGRYWHGALNGGKLLSDIIEYDPSTNTWSNRGDFPGGARQDAVVCEMNGYGYVCTGEDNYERKSDFWRFKP